MARHDEGYTLVELIVVILIFSIVTTLISVSFNRIVASSGQVVRSAETDIGGLIGLELMRSDVGLAGFGLPWSLPGGVSYKETDKGVMVDGCEKTAAWLYNDDPPDAPRAYVTGNNLGYNGSDYLVLKGTALGMSYTARSWSYLYYTPGGTVIKPSKSDMELKPEQSDRAIVVKHSISGGTSSRELVTDGAGSTAFTLTFNTPLPKGFVPASNEECYLVYGVAPSDKSSSADKESGSAATLAFPYNRADYFISRTDSISSRCARHTGVLYKTAVSQNGGNPMYYPILDCVADMQVIFFIDSNGDKVPDQHFDDLSNPEEHKFSAGEIREQLKEVRIYLLVQQGKKDSSYYYPLSELPIVVGDAALDKGLGRTLGSVWNEASMSAMTKDWRNYRWKVYTIVVQPKNL